MNTINEVIERQVAYEEGKQCAAEQIFEELEEFINIVEWRSYWDESKILSKIKELRTKYIV